MLLEIIKYVVCKNEGISFTDLNSETRKEEYVFVRYLIIYLFIEFKLGNKEKAGDIFGKDRTTANHAIKTIENYIETNKLIAEKIKRYINDVNTVNAAVEVITFVLTIDELEKKINSFLTKIEYIKSNKDEYKRILYSYEIFQFIN